MSQKPTWEDADSSMISAFRYDPDEQTLEVLFNRTGPLHLLRRPGRCG
jgi:hypothetical protein